MLGENTTAVIRKITQASDGIGSFTGVPTNVIMLRGKFDKFKSMEAVYNGRKDIIADFVFYCDIPAGVLIDETMTAVINGHQYPISFVENRGMRNTSYKLYLTVK
jgi:hypothetical protein